MYTAIVFVDSRRLSEKVAPCFGVRFGLTPIPSAGGGVSVIGVFAPKETKGTFPWQKKKWVLVESLPLDDYSDFLARNGTPEQKASWEATIAYAKKSVLANSLSPSPREGLML